MIAVSNATNPLRFDPTRTKLLRDAFSKAIRGRLKRFHAELIKLIVEEDAFGLKRAIAFNQRFAFESTAAKRDEFVKWVEEKLGPVVDAADTANLEDAYFHKFIQDGYVRGAGRAYDDTRKLERFSGRLEQYQGGKREFLNLALNSPESIEKLKVLASRTFDDLVGMTGALKTQLSRSLLDGMARGMNPRDVAKEMTKNMGMAYRRAELIARTEIIRAHAEGSLDALENLGVDEIGVMVEWSTAGDSRVCELCASLEGTIFKTSEAHGMFPRHPACRCTPIPANIGEDKRGQVRGKEKVTKSIEESLRKELSRRERKGLSKAQQTAKAREKSKWAGADKKVAKKRPQDAVEKLINE